MAMPGVIERLGLTLVRPFQNYSSSESKTLTLQKRWIIRESDPSNRDRLAAELKVSSLTAQLLVNRGIKEFSEAETFLWPRLNHLHDPELLPNIEKATQRIHQAVANKEKITIYGDYDVDGTTSAAVLQKFFEVVPYPVDTYIPHRVEEGYGLNLKAVEKIQSENTKLVITVDCGTKSYKEIDYLQSKGVDVIVTDHHDLGKEIPNAFAVINPKDPTSKYPFKSLAGAGVAFKLAWALAQSFSNQKKVSSKFRDYLMTSLAYVALGTVADVVPLLGENRIITKFGLTALQNINNPGIQALSDISGLQDRPLRSSDIAFRLGPRLNAAGRMGHAREAFELLTTEDTPRAQLLAQTLEQHNSDRKKVVESVLEKTNDMIVSEGLDKHPILVVAGEDFHVGIIGIVASRITEKYGRPSVIISLNGDLGKGSARSIPAFNVTQALEACADLLLGYGGHAQAAGMQIERKKIPEFRNCLVNHAEKILTKEDFVPCLDVDIEVLLAQLSTALVQEIEMLEPFGAQNPEPIFVATDLTVAGIPKVIGKNNHHISFYVRQGECSLRAIAFGMADPLADRLKNGSRCSLAFQPIINKFRGHVSLELMVRDFKLLD